MIPSASTAGIAPFPGRQAHARASTMLAMVEAVPMVIQCPLDRFMQLTASKNSLSGILPTPTRSIIWNTPYQNRVRGHGISRPMVGKSHEAAPISSDGVVYRLPSTGRLRRFGFPRMGFFHVYAGEIAKQHSPGGELIGINWSTHWFSFVGRGNDGSGEASAKFIVPRLG